MSNSTQRSVFKAETFERNGQMVTVYSKPLAMKVVSISDRVVGKTSNGKEFRIANVDTFDIDTGVEIETGRSAICYESNFENGIEEGNTYLGNITINPALAKGDKNRVALKLSHLSTSGALATEDAYAFDLEKVSSDVEVIEEA